MTLLQPNKSTSATLNIVLMLLILGIFLSATMLVVFYNRMVNVTHTLSRANVESKKLETENAELKDNIFALFDNAHVAAIAQSKELSEDKKPRYVEVDQKWFLASHY
jgi:cell division protein FtsL